MNYTDEQLTKLYALHKRAKRRELDVREIEPQHFIVSSYSNPEQPHLIADGLCDCKAAQCGLLCTHLSAVLYQADVLIWAEFEHRDRVTFIETRYRIRTGQATRRDKAQDARGRKLLAEGRVPERVAA